MSNKKKNRRKAWLMRELKRRSLKEESTKYKKAMDSGNLEEMADILGIKLK